MSETKTNSTCTILCWIIAAVLGLFVMFFFMNTVGLGGVLSFLLGLIAGLLLAYFLPRWFCSDARDTSLGGTASRHDTGTAGSASAAAASSGTSSAAPSAAAPATAASASDQTASGAADTPAASGDAAASRTAGDAGTTGATAAASAPASLMSAEIKPSQPLAGEAELAGRKGEWKYEAPAQDAAPAAKPAPKKAAPEKAAPKKAASAKKAPVAADGKPMTYDAPPADGTDDLKLISGVGPKLEQTLHELGFYRFEQVAGWRKKEIAWVDDRLKFKGRIERDDWIGQAKILAKGGETEFSKRKKK